MKQFSPTLTKGFKTPPGGSPLIDTLVKRSGIFMFSYSLTHRTLLSWSENAEEILGVKDISISRDGNLFLRHVHPDDRYALLTELEKGFKGESDYRATYRWIRPDSNEIRWLHCRAGLVRSPEGDLFEGIIVDLSQEFTGETSRIAGPDSIQTVISSFPTLVFTTDRDLRLLRINRPNGPQLFNFGDENFSFDALKIGKPLTAAFADEELVKDYKKISDSILDGKVSHHRRRISLEETVYNLEISPLLDNGLVQGLLFIISDISELVRLESDMANLQKAEGLSLLAAGVAHNFNNALQGILGHASILTLHPENTEFVTKAGDAIVELVNRASELTQQLLANNQDNSDEPIMLDLNTIAMSAINSLEDLFTSGIKVAVTFGNPEKVKAPRKPLTDAIIAILRNAKEAVSQGESSTKTLSIKTAQIRLSDCEISDLAAGTYTKLSITDSGSGMGSSTLKRCFEPFFTTKERDASTGVGIKPSGLGLPKSLSLIRDLGGTVEVESIKDLGTTVAIYLPVSETILENVSDKITPLRRRNPVILIVDDDHMVLQTVKNMIQDLGFDCITAEDSKKACSILKQYSRSIKLVLLDAVMPGADGATVLKSLKRINANVTVVGFSGATPQQTLPLLKAGAIQILRKPVGQAELKQVIDSTINQKKYMLGYE